MNDIVKKETTAISQSPTSITPAQMLQHAIENGANMEQLEKLMDLQERWEANEARREYTEAMASFRAKCPRIMKTREAYNSKYAGLAETVNQIKDLMSECGLSHSWKTGQKENSVSVTCCVTHIRGHQECTSLDAPPDNSGSKNSIQAIASTISYLERYTLFAILGLASSEMDNDGNNEAVCISANQAADFRALAEEVGANIPKLLQIFKIEDFEYLPANQADNMKNALEAKRKQK